MVSSTETGDLLGVCCGRGGMTPTPLPIKGRNDGVYGFLDGNREFSGAFWRKGDASQHQRLRMVVC